MVTNGGIEAITETSGDDVTDLVGQTAKAGPPPGFGIGVSNYLNHYVNVADAKAAGILTVDLAIGGYLLTNHPAAWLPWILYCIAVLLLTISGALALFTILPRTPRVGSSLIFWEDVRSRSSLDIYLDELKHVDEVHVERQYGAQNYIVSDILSKKYASVRWGIGTLMGAIPFVILRLILG